MPTCADCAKMNLNDENSWGEYWCGERGTYYPGSDSICSDFVERNGGGGGCYITTIVVEILGYDDYCIYLEQLRFFRDQVMKNDSKYQGVLKEYDEVGPKIVERLRNTPDKKEIAQELFEVYIKPVCGLLKNKLNDEAVELYMQMVNELKNL